jgi:hypothetical protein
VDSGFISPKKESEEEEEGELAEILAQQAAIHRVDDLFKLINTVNIFLTKFLSG